MSKTKAVKMNHEISSLVTLFSPESKPSEDDMRVVRTMQKNGPYWFDGQYPTVGVTEELKHPRGGSYIRVKAEASQRRKLYPCEG